MMLWPPRVLTAVSHTVEGVGDAPKGGVEANGEDGEGQRLLLLLQLR